jgi:hypothetical protein
MDVNSIAGKTKKWDAYWISPEGFILGVGKKHINEIISEPSAFGFDRDYVEAVYKGHGEKLGMEGRARQELMRELLLKGWIRIRYSQRNDSFVVQCFQLRKRQKDYLLQWAYDEIHYRRREYSDVRLITEKGVIQTSLQSIVSESLLDEKNVPLHKIFYVKDASDMKKYEKPAFDTVAELLQYQAEQRRKELVEKKTGKNEKTEQLSLTAMRSARILRVFCLKKEFYIRAMFPGGRVAA